MIEKEVLQRLLDRIAYQYGIITELQAQMAPAAEAAEATIGSSNAGITFTAVNTGTPGNLIQVQFHSPGASATLAVDVLNTLEGSGKLIYVTLATNGSAVITSTANDILALVNADCACQQVVVASLPETSNGSSVVSVTAPTTLLTGGINGDYTAMVVGTADADVVAQLTTAASLLDANITADRFFELVPYWGGFLAGLTNYFAAVGQTGLLSGYLLENSLKVHRDFDVVFNKIYGNHLDAALVFRPDTVTLATGEVTVSGSDRAVLDLKFATARIAQTTNIVNLIAKQYGSGGTQITIVAEQAVGNSQPTEVSSVSGSDITLSLGTNGGGSPNATPAAVKAAIEADLDASSLIQVTTSGTGVLSAWEVVTLSLGSSVSYADNWLVFTSAIYGRKGADTTIAFVDPGGSNEPLTITVDDYLPEITVSLETDGSGDIVSTAADIKTLWDADAVAKSWATVAFGGSQTGTGIVYEQSSGSAINLVSARTVAYTPGTQLGAGDGPTSNTNYAAQRLSVEYTPSNRGAGLDIYPITPSATLVTGSGNSEITFTAYSPDYDGRAGEKISIEYVNPGSASALTVSVTTAYRIIVTLAHNGTSLISGSNTATLVAAAIDAASLAETPPLLQTPVVGGTGADSVSVMGRTYLAARISGAGIRIEADTEATGIGGTDSNNIQVRLYDSNSTDTLALSRSGVSPNYTYTITLEGTSTNPRVTTVQEIVDLLGTGPYAGQLVATALGDADTVVSYGTPALYLRGGTGPETQRESVYALTTYRSDTTTRTVNFTVEDESLELTRNLVIEDNYVPVFSAATNGDMTVTQSTPASGSNIGWKVFDGDAATQWTPSPQPTNTTSQWVRIDFGEDVLVKIGAYGIQASDTPTTDDFADWRVEGSLDGSNWRVLDVRENMGGSLEAEVENKFYVSNPLPFRYYRYVALTSTSGASSLIGWTLYEVDEYFQVNDIELTSGGESGDSLVVSQIVERTITA